MVIGRSAKGEMTGKPDSSARYCFSTFVSTDRLGVKHHSAMARSSSWDLSAACHSALYREMVST
jgi:hypothetical protein